MTKTKTLFSLETSVHVHFHCVAFLSRSALPSGRESWPGQYLLRLRHEIVRGCQVVPQILPGGCGSAAPGWAAPGCTGLR